MSQPDFLVIGAQKAGTTWLDKMFKSHPDIWTPVVKELQFFNEFFMPNAFSWADSHRKNHALKAIEYSIKDKKNVDWNKLSQANHIASGTSIDLGWYKKIFDFANANTTKGEMTPEYSLLGQDDVNKISKYFPNLKIILVIREPLERALSGIRMRLLQNSIAKSDQKTIDDFVVSAASDWDVIERGNYESIIRKYSLAFGEDKIKIYLSSDFKNNPKDSLKSLSMFLGVDYQKFKGEVSERVHVGKQYNISESAISEVKHYQESNCEWFSANKNKFKI